MAAPMFAFGEIKLAEVLPVARSLTSGHGRDLVEFAGGMRENCQGIQYNE